MSQVATGEAITKTPKHHYSALAGSPKTALIGWLKFFSSTGLQLSNVSNISL